MPSIDQGTVRVSAPLVAVPWMCAGCGRDATDGVLHVDMRAATAAAVGDRRWGRRGRLDAERVSFADVLMVPGRARWLVSCPACYVGEGHDCRACYGIDLSVCRSVYALARWQEHLSDKSWFSGTDWVPFVADVARRYGPVEPTGVR